MATFSSTISTVATGSASPPPSDPRQECHTIRPRLPPALSNRGAGPYYGGVKPPRRTMARRFRHLGALGAPAHWAAAVLYASLPGVAAARQVRMPTATIVG